MNACSVYVLAFSRTSSLVMGGRAVERPVGSPMVAVKSPMRRTAVCPSSWNCLSFSMATVCPRWMSGAVGSTPSLMRSGRLSASFSVSSFSLRTLAVPEVIFCSAWVMVLLLMTWFLVE